MMTAAQDPLPTSTLATQTTNGVGRVARATLWAAPTLLVIGTILLMTPNAWTVAHAIYLAGTAGMVVAGITMGRLEIGSGVPGLLGRIGGGLTVAGALALSSQFAIDFHVMARAGGERAIAADLIAELRQSPLAEVVLYTVGPALLFVGLMLFGAVLSRLIRGPGWLLVAGSALMGLARVLDQRAVEVVALIVIVIASGWLARWLDGVSGRGGNNFPQR